MKILVIGHPDAVRGFALVGVSGQSVTTADAVNQALDTALDDSDTGIILITDDVAELARRRVDALKTQRTTPLIVEIPGPAGPQPDRPALSDIIRQTTGVRL